MEEEEEVIRTGENEGIERGVDDNKEKNLYRISKKKYINKRRE